MQFAGGPRDLIGYGEHAPDIKWPGDRRVAISFVVNYEEGGENTPVNGDPSSELFLNETPGGYPRMGVRDIAIESQYEYGSRVGFWRLLRLFNAHRMPFTCYAVGKAVEQNPGIVAALERDGHEVASHSYRWIDYQHVAPSVEREHIIKAIRAIQAASPSGRAPVGWYTGRLSPNTRALVCSVYKELGLPLLYDSDSYADELPYWIRSPVEGAPDHVGHLVLPYSLDLNDMKHCVAPGFTAPSGFLDYMTSSLETALHEAHTYNRPCFLSVGLHGRIAGRPARAAALQRFLEIVEKHRDKVWVCTREQAARHFASEFPYRPLASPAHVLSPDSDRVSMG